MNEEGRRKQRNARSIRLLALMAALSAAYICLLTAVRTLTRSDQWDGILGVILGLCICSFPARHFVELLIYWRIEGRRFRSRRARSWWVAANAFVLLAGWLVIVIGTMRFIPAR